MLELLPRVSACSYEGDLIAAQGGSLEVICDRKQSSEVRIFSNEGINIYGVVATSLGGAVVFGERRLAFVPQALLSRNCDLPPAYGKSFLDQILAVKELEGGQVAVLFTCNTAFLFEVDVTKGSLELRERRRVQSAHTAVLYGLLAAHLNPRTPADMWIRWGDLSTQLGLLEEAAACYGRAIKVDVGNFTYYEKRIQALDALGYRPLAMKIRLQAMQQINNANKQVSFQWFQENIRLVAGYYIGANDEDKAITCLEVFITRSREFGEDARAQHETLLGMLLAKGRYVEASRSILALVDGITVVRGPGDMAGQPALDIFFLGGVYFVRPYPPPDNVEIHVEDKFPSEMLSRLIVCFLGMNKRDLATFLKDVLLARDLNDPSLECHLLEVARAFHYNLSYKSCRLFLETVREHGELMENAELWFIYGNALSALKDPAGAAEAFKSASRMPALEQKRPETAFIVSELLLPEHVDARINLSGLQQKAGLSEEALATLQGYDLDTCTHLPDERLLLRQADVLFEEKKVEQFVRCARMLLTPHFYEIHRNPKVFAKRRSSKNTLGMQLSNTLRVSAMNVIQNTNWDKFVRPLGSVAMSEGRTTNDMDANMMESLGVKEVPSSPVRTTDEVITVVIPAASVVDEGALRLLSSSLDCRLASHSLDSNKIAFGGVKSLSIWDPSYFTINGSRVVCVGSGVQTIEDAV